MLAGAISKRRTDMRLYTAAVLGALTLGLAACDPHAADSTGAASPPADAPAAAPTAPATPVVSAEFAPAFRLIGTEPFWALKIDKDNMVLSRPEQSDLTVEHGGPVGGDGHAQWSGEGLTASVTKATCSDGMSDRTYAYTAEAKLGAVVLKGCGDAEATFGS
jgi:uncharacterized membrane protein